MSLEQNRLLPVLVAIVIAAIMVTGMAVPLLQGTASQAKSPEPGLNQGKTLSASPLGLISTTDSLASSSSLTELQNSVSYVPPGSLAIGPLIGENITVYLGLNTVNGSLLSNFLRQVSNPASPAYGHYMSHSSFMKLFEPGASVYQSIAAYYSSSGITVVPGNDRLFMQMYGEATQFDELFNTSIQLYDTQMGTYYFNTEPLYVPSAFSGAISGAIGFSDYPYLQAMLLVNPASNMTVSQAVNASNNGFGGATSPQPPYTPYAMQLAYNETALMNSGYQGQYETVAVTDAYGDPTLAADMATYDSLYNLPSPASFQTMYPFGQPNLLGTVTQSLNAAISLWEVETSLDAELSHGFAPQANVISVVSPDAGYTLIQTVAYLITNQLANVISNSWGAPEPEVGAFATYMHPFFKMAAAEGITVLAASGDQGSAGYDTSVPRSVLWPSDDPYVTAVGGTTIFMNGTVSTVSNPLNGPPAVPEVFNPVAMVNETAWDGYTGGGYSVIFPRPYWQTGYGLPESGAAAAERGIPDVSANAMFGGNDFVFNGQTGGSYLFGGTSFASPAWAGMVATMDSYVAFVQGSQLGFLNPALYGIFNSPVYNRSFHDVTVGYNGPGGYYNAGPGWDPVTGIGSPDISFLAHELAEYRYVAGGYGDFNSSNNTGVSAAIQTVLPDRAVGSSSNLFYVSEKLADGTTLMLGYAVNNNMQTGAWFYSIIPSSSQFGTSFTDYGIPGSAGTNGTFSNYTIIETSQYQWAFRVNSVTVGTYSTAAAGSGRNAPEFLVSALGVTSRYNILGPVLFRNMSYVKGGSFHPVLSEMSLEQTNIYSSYSPPYFFPNPYGVATYNSSAREIIAGSGIGYENGTVLFGTFHPTPPTTVFLEYPQVVSLYAQHVASSAAAGATVFGMNTTFPSGQNDFNNFYLVPVLGPASWSFSLDQATSAGVYLSQVNASYVHFFLSLQPLAGSGNLTSVPVTVDVSVHAGQFAIGSASLTLNLPTDGSVVEYSVPFLSESGVIPSGSYISMSVSWYMVQAAGTGIGYAILLHSGQEYPISLALQVYNPVDMSPLYASAQNGTVYITSDIFSPFGSGDMGSVAGDITYTSGGYSYIISPPVIRSGNTYTWIVNESLLSAGTYNFTATAFDIQGNYNRNTTQFTVTSASVQTNAPEHPHKPPRPPKPAEIERPG